MHDDDGIIKATRIAARPKRESQVGKHESLVNLALGVGDELEKPKCQRR